MHHIARWNDIVVRELTKALTDKDKDGEKFWRSMLI